MSHLHHITNPPSPLIYIHGISAFALLLDSRDGVMVLLTPSALVEFFFGTLSVVLRLWVLRRRESRVLVIGGRRRRGGRMVVVNVVVTVRCRLVIISRLIHAMICYLDGRSGLIPITSFRCFGTDLILFLLVRGFGCWIVFPVRSWALKALRRNITHLVNTLERLSLSILFDWQVVADMIVFFSVLV